MSDLKYLLIYGGLDDAHVRFPERILRQKGIACAFYDPLRLARVNLEPLNVEMKAEICAETLISSGGKEEVESIKLLVPEQISYIWVRNKKFVDCIESSSDQWAYVSVNEHTNFLKSLIRLYDIKHFNDIYRVSSIKHKAVQISIAKDVGFRVPQTLISSHKKKIVSFIEKYNDIIVKPMSLNFVPPPLDKSTSFATILTNSVTKEEIARASRESLAAAPAIYQKRIEKAYEIRLAAFGNDAVAYRIDSQKSQSGELDWRRAQYEDIYAPMNATGEMRELSRRFLHASGLHYGIFDLIVDTEGQLWFLECNADGQWAWLERQGEGPIAEMFARNISRMIKSTFRMAS
ncbi:MAG: hypothetical protein KatS3mg119_2378 [Rhodothalassiaceae bacterium]|nr:MAG: hypothetical protein KatS3mg119_2378 [Rhodothalassiaceae bacterium]